MSQQPLGPPADDSSPLPPPMTTWASRKRLAQLGMSALVLAACVWLFRQLDFEQLLATLRHTDARLIALAVALNLTVNTAARVWRWEALLGPLPHRGRGAQFWELVPLQFASQAASNLLPARAGEVLRTLEPHRRHGYPVGALIASQLVEKVVEATSLSLIALPILLLPGSRPPAVVMVSLYVLLGCGLGGISAVVLVARRAAARAAMASSLPTDEAAATASAETSNAAGWRGRVRAAIGHFLERLTEAVRLMHSPRVWLKALAASGLSDLTDVAMVALCLIGVGVHVGPPGWFVTFVAVNVAIAIPSTPGQLGVLEAGAVLALGALGVPKSEALAFALLYHAAHLIPPTVVGVLGPLSPLRAVEPEPK